MVISDAPDELVEVKNDHNYRVYFSFKGNLTLDEEAGKDTYRLITSDCCVDFCNRDKALEALENLKKDFYLSKYFQIEDMSDLLQEKLFFIPDPYGKKPNPHNDDSLGNCYDEKLKLDKDGLLVASTGDNNPVFFSQLALFVLNLDAILFFTAEKDLTSYFEESGDYFYCLIFDSDNSKLHIVQRTEEYIDGFNCSYEDKTCLSLDIKPEHGIKAMIENFIQEVHNLSGYDDLKNFLIGEFIR